MGISRPMTPTALRSVKNETMNSLPGGCVVVAVMVALSLLSVIGRRRNQPFCAVC
jgi:hypothetical protein